ncbi:hypothetical protein PR048_031582 [Dryococelus australis]|uniref:DNA helicase n=1 Tax=Dryococelus australis TaxID=614101 RepID=A0ABQ9G9Q6_9NEOP|nr:hypothetical protein PR048_031582 [Dryococelus australis]
MTGSENSHDDPSIPRKERFPFRITSQGTGQQTACRVQTEIIHFVNSLKSHLSLVHVPPIRNALEFSERPHAQKASLVGFPVLSSIYTTNTSSTVVSYLHPHSDSHRQDSWSLDLCIVPECKGGGNGRSLRKPSDQRHRPARFPHVKIRSDPTGDRIRIALSGKSVARSSETSMTLNQMKITAFLLQQLAAAEVNGGGLWRKISFVHDNRDYCIVHKGPDWLVLELRCSVFGTQNSYETILNVPPMCRTRKRTHTWHVSSFVHLPPSLFAASKASPPPPARPRRLPGYDTIPPPPQHHGYPHQAPTMDPLWREDRSTLCARQGFVTSWRGQGIADTPTGIHTCLLPSFFSIASPYYIRFHSSFKGPPWGRVGVVVRLLASHLGKPGSDVRIVRDDAAGRRVFSGFSRFSLPLRSDTDPYSPRFTLIGSQDLVDAARQFRSLRLAAMGHLTRVALSPLWFPRFSATNVDKITRDSGALNIEVLRADEGEVSCLRSRARMQGRGKREIPEKTADQRHRQASGRDPHRKSSSVAIDTVMDTEQITTYPVEFLNSLQLSGVPSHKLQLELGVPFELVNKLGTLEMRDLVGPVSTWVSSDTSADKSQLQARTLLRRGGPVACVVRTFPKRVAR